MQHDASRGPLDPHALDGPAAARAVLDIYTYHLQILTSLDRIISFSRLALQN